MLWVVRGPSAPPGGDHHLVLTYRTFGRDQAALQTCHIRDQGSLQASVARYSRQHNVEEDVLLT